MTTQFRIVIVHLSRYDDYGVYQGNRLLFRGTLEDALAHRELVQG